jgi:hypothetical protein
MKNSSTIWIILLVVIIAAGGIWLYTANAPASKNLKPAPAPISAADAAALAAQNAKAHAMFEEGISASATTTQKKSVK